MASTHPTRSHRSPDRDGITDAVGSAVGHAVDAAAEAADDAAALMGEQIERIKPKLRGFIHLGTAPLALATGMVLVVLAPTVLARLGAAVFCLTSTALFSTSAAFHRGRWSHRTHDVLRRLDHSNIFGIIAGTYTPFALLLLTRERATVLLAVVWAGAVAGILFRTLWLSAPRWLYVPVYVALGWVSIFFVGDMYHAAAGGPAVVWLLAAGGVLYTLGAVVYGTRTPDPSPRWFGFHEIFHVLTVLAFACHAVAVGLTVLRA